MKLKVDVKLDDQKIENTVKNAILKKGVEITCKNCGAKFFMNIESGPCPRCGTPYELAFKL